MGEIIDEINDIFKLDTMVGEYAAHCVSIDKLNNLQFALYQSALCYDKSNINWRCVYE